MPQVRTPRQAQAGAASGYEARSPCPCALRVGATRARVLSACRPPRATGSCADLTLGAVVAPGGDLGPPTPGQTQGSQPFPRGVVFPDCVVKAAVHGDESQRDVTCVLRLHYTQLEPGLSGLFVQGTACCCSGFLPRRRVTLQPLQRAAKAAANLFYPLKMSPPHLTSKRGVPVRRGTPLPSAPSQCAPSGSGR